MGNLCDQPKNMEMRGYVRSRADDRNLRAIYEIETKVLGSGSYGNVFRAVSKRDRTIKVAIKVINKSLLSEDDLESLKNETNFIESYFSNILRNTPRK